MEGRAAKRDSKDESNKEGDILERADKRREVSVSPLRTRGSISGGGNFSRRGSDEHQSAPRLHLLVRFSFCSAAIDDSITFAKGRENAANGEKGREGDEMAGGSLTHGDETRGDRAVGNADKPFVSFLR